MNSFTDYTKYEDINQSSDDFPANQHFNNSDDDGIALARRLSNLNVSSTSNVDDQRSTTPLPSSRVFQVMELSPATLNGLRSYGGNNSITSSPCVTEVTQVVANTTFVDKSLRLPSFGTTSSNRGSPSTSQVSVGSIPPTLAASLLPSRHHYDLTPIARNTSSTVDSYTQYGNEHNGRNRHVTVTPSDENDCDQDEGLFLHGEHLAIPSDFINSTGYEAFDGPSVPPLQPPPFRAARQSINYINGNLRDTSVHNDSNIPPQIEFPSRKYYTFTSRQQYEDEMYFSHSGGHQQFQPAMKPYQPNRQENFDIETLPAEELQRIFIPRSVPVNAPNIPNPEVGSSSATDESDTHQNHRLLRSAIPLDDAGRQWSIPSLRMAQRLHGSTTSLTDTTDLDDEDSLIYIHPTSNNQNIPMRVPDVNEVGCSPGFIDISAQDDNLTISSRGSSLCHLDDLNHDYGNNTFLPLPAASDAFSDDTDSVEAVAVGGEFFETHQSDSSRRRKRKQIQKEAFEWLQSVEVDQNVFAEAASSKFLTSGNHVEENYFRQDHLHHQLQTPLRNEDSYIASGPLRTLRRQSSPSVLLQRQISSPASLMSNRNDDINDIHRF